MVERILALLHIFAIFIAHIIESEKNALCDSTAAAKDIKEMKNKKGETRSNIINALMNLEECKRALVAAACIDSNLTLNDLEKTQNTKNMPPKVIYDKKTTTPIMPIVKHKNPNALYLKSKVSQEKTFITNLFNDTTSSSDISRKLSPAKRGQAKNIARKAGNAYSQGAKLIATRPQTVKPLLKFQNESLQTLKLKHAEGKF